MFYRKNVGGKERIARLVAGVLMGVCGLFFFGATPLGWLVLGAGAMTVVTGLVGFCPACAMVGRKLPGGPQ